MKTAIVIIALVCCWLSISSAWAIDCLSAPGDPKTGWYSWREIEGRRCWFKKTGAMPPKWELHWATAVEQEPRSMQPVSSPDVMTGEAAEPAAETTRAEAKPPTVPQFKTIRVKPALPNALRLGNEHVDLMNGVSLSAMGALAGARQRPSGMVRADPFNARFTGSRD